MDIILGNSLDKLKELEDNSVDSIVTDPPYELGFMGKKWDNTGIANNVELWAECLRVLKPGGHLLAFSGTRTYHRMAVAIEDAGFEIRDMIEWVYGSGFPKSLNIGKAVDKIQRGSRVVELINALIEKGHTLKELGENAGIPSLESSYRDWTIGGHKPEERSWERMLTGLGFSEKDGLNIIEKRIVKLGGGNAYTFREGEVRDWEQKITKGTSEWEGWGTALKPAHETIAVAQKPLTAVPFYGNIEEEIKSILCQLLLSVKTANKNLVLNHHGLSEELDIAQWIVKDSTNTQVALSVVMDMLQLELKTNTNWSIELLCLSFLKEIWKHTNIFTTEMKTSLIIELKTLNLLVSESILANITQSKKIKQDGENANVYFVENYLNAVSLKWNATLTHFAQENVMSKENKLTFAPNHEPICMARKPLSEKTVAENVLKWGTGGIDIDGSRVAGKPRTTHKNGNFTGNSNKDAIFPMPNIKTSEPLGRFPANLIHDNSDEVRECFPETKSGAMNGTYKNTMMKGEPGIRDGKEIHLHQEASSGNASRFFKSILYYPKASKKERNMGCEKIENEKFTAGNYSQSPVCKTCNKTLNGTNNHSNCSGGVYYREMDSKKTSNNHPTVKPIALMEYLIKMVTPKGGIVLDPFMGSGSTGVAAKKNGYDFIGIDMTPEYIEIAKARINATEIENRLI